MLRRAVLRSHHNCTYVHGIPVAQNRRARLPPGFALSSPKSGDGASPTASAAPVEAYADELGVAVGVVDSAAGALLAVAGSVGAVCAGAAVSGTVGVVVVAAGAAVSGTVGVVVVAAGAGVVGVAAVAAAAAGAALVEGPAGASAAKCAVDRCPLGYAGSGACTGATAACASTYDGGASAGSPENSSGLNGSSSGGGGPGGGWFAYACELDRIGTAVMYGWSVEWPYPGVIVGHTCTGYWGLLADGGWCPCRACRCLRRAKKMLTRNAINAAAAAMCVSVLSSTTRNHVPAINRNMEIRAYYTN